MANAPSMDSPAGGPLRGLRIVEFAGIGPGPLAGRMLVDLGAAVTVIDRPDAEQRLGGGTSLHRGKTRVTVDLKTDVGLATARRLISEADALIEGFRPGVMERLGLGPEVLCAAHPRLVYARLTGWGQTGPLAHAAGHDINYVALSGMMALAARPGQPPALPATLLGDVGGGALMMLVGLLAALWETQRSGRGQVIDAAMVDGIGYMGSLVRALQGDGFWPREPERNFFLHRSHFYDCFECADGLHLSLGAIEPAFYRELMARLEITPEPPQHDTEAWPELRLRVAARLREHPRDEWLRRLEGTDACVAPVLSPDEAPMHPHQQARGNHRQRDGVWWPTPAPRFSRTRTDESD